jgi:hypothetical protein
VTFAPKREGPTQSKDPLHVGSVEGRFREFPRRLGALSRFLFAGYFFSGMPVSETEAHR